MDDFGRECKVSHKSGEQEDNTSEEIVMQIKGIGSHLPINFTLIIKFFKPKSRQGRKKKGKKCFAFKEGLSVRPSPFAYSLDI